jgi:hypothetical protein
MSNIIDNLLLNESITASTSPITEQVTKDKPSLFDSLLSNISSPEEINLNNTIATKIGTKEIIQKVEEISSVDNLELVDSLDVKDLESVKIESDNKEQKLTSTGTLLDRLIIEAKKGTKEIDNIGTKESLELDDIKSLSNTKTLINGEIASPVPVVSEESTQLDDNKIENKTSSSNNSKIVTNSELTSSIIIEENIISDEINKLDNKVNISVDEISEETTSIDSSISEKLILDIDIQNKEESDTKTVSLLDRLISEAKKDNKNILNKKIDSTIDKLNVDEENKLDVNSIVKIDNNDFLNIEDNKIVELELLNETQKDENKLDIKNVDVKVASLDSSLEKLNIPETILPVIVKESKDIVENKKETISQNNEVKTKSKVILKDSLLENITQKVEVSKESISTDLANEKLILNPSSIGLSNQEIVNNNLIDLETTGESLGINNNSIPIVSNEVVTEENKTEIVTIKKDEKLSLMDQLIQKNTEKLTLDTISNEQFDPSLKEVVTKDLISSIYLGSQKNKINSQSLFNKNEAIAILKDGNSIQAVKTSAEMLDLGLEDVIVDQSITVEKSELKQLDKKNLIENLFLEKSVKSEEIKGLITKSVEASNALIENSINLASDVTVNVNSPISYNIQSKIIGAKQQMSAMMSDIARQMYENYKPPVTAFKINLNPTELGSIAILMKSDKNSGLSISMNVSNNVTLETLIENQNVLKNSLNKTFDESTKFNLDFSSSNQNNNNQSSSNNQSNNRQFEQQMGTQEVLKLKEDNKDIEEKVIDYM